MTKTLKLTKTMRVIDKPKAVAPQGLDYRTAKRHLAAFGIYLYYNTEYREYRMNKGNREATAYYTDDLDDAVGTAYSQYINK